MLISLDPFRLLLISLAGCLNQHQRDVIGYLEEENRVLREQLSRNLTDNSSERNELHVESGGLFSDSL